MAARVAAALVVVAVGLLPSDGLSPCRQTSPRGDGVILPSPSRRARPRFDGIPPTPSVTRRVAAAGLLASFVAGLRPSAAFDNGVPEMALFANFTKYPGTQPSLGLQRDGKLRRCEYAPNCYSTSGDEYARLKLWKPSPGSDAMGELLETIQAYPPGQNKVDKGGFSIINASADYLYVQFESLKLGFIDDVEFAVTGGAVQVRSSSRLGFLDLEVNAKRLNYISKQLRAKGWTAPAIKPADYPEHFLQAFQLTFTYDDYIRSVVSPLECPCPSEPMACGGPSLRPPPDPSKEGAQ